MISKKDTPVLAEDAEEISYKENCKGDQYVEEPKVNNTWNKEYCPSPCLGNGDCPSGAQCIDWSDDIGPNHTCVCRMGLVMEAGRCVCKSLQNNLLLDTTLIVFFQLDHRQLQYLMKLLLWKKRKNLLPWHYPNQQALFSLDLLLQH